MASGSVGTATIVHLLSAGDHVVACDDMYGGSYRLFERVFRQQGIDFSYVDMADPDNLAKAMRKNTRMVWVETPSNPLLKVVDIAKAAEVAHTSGALLAVDNTFMSPYFQRPIELGADLVMHSTTKYINGHSDLVGGVLITNDENVAERLKFLSNAIGGIQSTFDAYMCLRSLKTLAVRMKAHESNALAVARFLEAHPKVAAVRFTGLPSHPQHALANRQMTGHGGMLTCNVAGDLDATRRFLSSVRVFALAESLGGVESLIEHPAIMTHASLPQAVREQLGIGDNLVRISVGIEAEADLLRDLDRALAVV
jgi:cystathionine gamma-lyase